MTAGSPQDSARSIAMRMIEMVGAEIVKSSGYDKAAWLWLVSERMQTQEPIADAVIRTEAASGVYRSLIEQYIRSSKSAAVENLTDLEKIKATLRAGNAVVQIKGADGAYAAKPLKACTPLDMDVLAEQYERSSAADARRGRFYRMVAQQMRLAGLGEQATVSQLLAI